MKTCNKCGKKKTVYEFHRNKKTRDGRVHSCKVCVSKYQKAYNAKKRGETSVKAEPVANSISLKAGDRVTITITLEVEA